jgi:galactokinase
MMGGGFGGCTINLVKAEAVSELINEGKEMYRREMGRELSAYVAETANGTELVKEKPSASAEGWGCGFGLVS